jgi:hypothetical protein
MLPAGRGPGHADAAAGVVPAVRGKEGDEGEGPEGARIPAAEGVESLGDGVHGNSSMEKGFAK